MSSLAKSLLTELRRVADPARAPAMQAYMKSDMPYLGVSAVPLRQVCKTVFAGLEWPDSAAWQADVRALWRGAHFREERYAAIALAGVRNARSFQRIDARGLYEEMIVTGAWWDYVDTIATRRLWELLQRDRGPARRMMIAWSTEDNMWKRRSAILCQINAREKTDLGMLYACIEPSLGSREFFLRKAIGWALRQYARTDAAEVRRYVAAHADQLSGLSRREALKHVGSDCAVAA